MKFLAIDTSGKRLTVVCENDGVFVASDCDCAMQHSVRLFPEIDGVLSRAGVALADLDFIACVVGPGSFTGIRIGISAVKGLCFGAGKRAVAVTSFDALAYAEKSADKIAVVDAGHGYLYAEGFGAAALARGYYPAEEVLALSERTSAPLLSAQELAFPAKVVDVAVGLRNAARARAEVEDGEELAALYLRKSNAEEGR